MKRIIAILLSIIGFGHAQDLEDGHKVDPLLSMVMLNKSVSLSRQYTKESIKEALGKFVEIESIELSDDLIMVNFKGGQLIAMDMKMPIPWGDLEGPAATSWLWNNATAEIKAHSSHLVISLLGFNKSKIERHVLITKFTAFALHSEHTIGVYWGNGTTVLPKERFVDLASACTTENPAVMLWCEFRIQKNQGNTFNIITNGMKHLGAMDIEIIGTKNGEESLYFCIDLAVYMAKGTKIKNGDTVGDEVNKIKTEYAKSIWERPDKVLRVYK